MTTIQVRLENEKGYLHGRYVFVLNEMPSENEFFRMIYAVANVDDNLFKIDGRMNLKLFDDLIGKDVIIDLEYKLCRK